MVGEIKLDINWTAGKGKLGHGSLEQESHELYYFWADDEEFIYNPQSPLNLIINNDSLLHEYSLQYAL